MIYMQAILDMNDIVMFEDRFVLESCDFLIILLKKNISNHLLESIHVQMHFFLYFYLFDTATNLRLMYT